MPHHPHPAPERCLNCHHALHGTAYCGQCGQAAHVPARLTLRHLLHELPHVVWHVDKGVIYTLQEMWRAPGHAIRRYLRGQRAAFFPPLSLLLLLAGVSSFVYLALHIQPYYRPPGVSSHLYASQERFMHFVAKYQAWMQVALLPVSAGIAHLFLRRRTGLFYAEQLTACALLAGATAGWTLAFVPLLKYYSGTPQVLAVTLAMTALMLLYRAWGFAQLQYEGPGDRVRRWGLAFGLILTDYVVTVSLVGFALFVLTRLAH